MISNKVTGYFVGQLKEPYKLSQIMFSSYSLYSMIEFIKPRGGAIWDEEQNLLYKFEGTIEHMLRHPEEINS